MNKMKRMVIMGAAVGILFCGCQAASVTETPTSYDDTKDKLLQESQTKISYYEGLVVDLQEQLLDTKSAL